jgi:hypothetical protein
MGDEREALLSRVGSQERGGHGATHQILLEKKGELDVVYIDGRALTTVDSIYERLIAKAIASHPLKGKATARKPPSKAKLRARVERLLNEASAGE